MNGKFWKPSDIWKNRGSVQISGPEEPGQKIWLCLTLIANDSKEPLPNQKVKLYHTSGAGEYDPMDPSDESTARLNGSGTTNREGQLFVQTILPGDYGNSKDNRHIHTTVQNASPEAYDIHFRQYSGIMGRKFIARSDQHFLADLKMLEDSTLVTFLILEVKDPAVPIQQIAQRLPDCEWCGAREAPEKLSWQTSIADEKEAGERIILEGTVFEKDGVTPAEGVTIYAYHTNSQGIYARRGNETGNGRRHGYLRGWVKTNTDGQYRFQTIKPAPYPSHNEPAHVHMTLWRDDFEEYWINSTWFKR